MASSRQRLIFSSDVNRFFIEECLFLVAFSCYIFATWFTYTGYQSFFGLNYNSFRRIMYGISLVCLAVKYILQRNSLKENILVIFVGLVLLVSALVSNSHLLIWCYIFIICARHVSIKPISFCFFMVLFLIGVIAFTGYFLGVTSSNNLASTVTRGARYSLGFAHPNTLAFYLLAFELAWISMRYEFLRLRDLVILIVFSTISHFLTYSRTADGAFFLLIAGVVALLFVRKHPSLKNRRRNCKLQLLLFALYASIGAVVAFSIYSMFFYNGSNQAWAKLDSFSSGRLHLAHQYLNETGITAFGHSFEDSAVQNIDIHGEDITFLVDNLYCNVLLCYGFVTWVLSFVGVLLAILRLSHSRQRVWLLGITIFLMVGLFEALFFKLSFNFGVLGLQAAIYKDAFADSTWDESAPSVLPLYAKLCNPAQTK